MITYELLYLNQNSREKKPSFDRFIDCFNEVVFKSPGDNNATGRIVPNRKPLCCPAPPRNRSDHGLALAERARTTVARRRPSRTKSRGAPRPLRRMGGGARAPGARLHGRPRPVVAAPPSKPCRGAGRVQPRGPLGGRQPLGLGDESRARVGARLADHPRVGVLAALLLAVASGPSGAVALSGRVS